MVFCIAGELELPSCLAFSFMNRSERFNKNCSENTYFDLNAWYRPITDLIMKLVAYSFTRSVALGAVHTGNNS